MSPSFQNTCAIIITYHPDADFPDRLERVLAQFAEAIIVDNASNASAARMLHALGEISNVTLFNNAVNVGVAAALNQGMVVASEKGFEWALTLDQDTQVYSDIRKHLSDICAQSSGNLIVGGNYWNVHRQKNFINCRDGKATIERKTLITSGTLLSIAFAQRIGGFREDYFIDSVDHEFCLRARAHNCKILMCCKPLMCHSIGTPKIISGWMSGLSSFNHTPTRKYFIARNATATARHYFSQEPVWVLRQVARLMFDFASIVFTETQKKKKIRAFSIGLLHGVIGRMGPIEQTWPDGAR